MHTPDTPAISENELFTDKLHCTINDTSGHGDPIRNTSAGALWKKSSDGQDERKRLQTVIHVRGFYKMRQGEELFTYEACRIRYISDLSYADGGLATEQKFVAENDAAMMLYKQSTYNKNEFCVQQKVAKAFRQNLDTSPSEMNNDVVLMLSLVSAIATDVVAPTECPYSESNFGSYLNDLVTVQDTLAFHVCPIRIF